MHRNLIVHLHESSDVVGLCHPGDPFGVLTWTLLLDPSG